MITFVCKRCHYTASTKQALVKHLNKQKTCSILFENIERSTLLEELKEKKKDLNNDCSYCKYCNQGFNTKSNMYRHTKICKANLTTLEDINKLKKELDQLKKMMGNNFIQNNIQNIQNNFNIELKDFGCEKQAHLSKELLHRCFADKAIVDLIESLHFDKDCPENHNVRLKSKKQELMEIYSDGKWQVKDQDKTLTELIQSGYRILRMHGKKYKSDIMEEEDIDEDDYNETIKWLESIYEDKKLQKPVKRDLIILFINNQTMLLERERS